VPLTLGVRPRSRANQNSNEKVNIVFEYNPTEHPDAGSWLSLSEADRLAAVERHHKKARIKLPNTRGHAALHVMVENQLAEAYEPTIRAMTRLMHEGLNRHDAIHAISSVVTEYLFEAMNSGRDDSPEVTKSVIAAGIERLSAKSWLEKYKQ